MCVKHLYREKHDLPMTGDVPNALQYPIGEAHHSAKLTDSQVREMRTLYAQGGVTLRALAARYGVSGPTIYRAVSRKDWRHVD